MDQDQGEVDEESYGLLPKLLEKLGCWGMSVTAGPGRINRSLGEGSEFQGSLDSWVEGSRVPTIVGSRFLRGSVHSKVGR